MAMTMRLGPDLSDRGVSISKGASTSPEREQPRLEMHRSFSCNFYFFGFGVDVVDTASKTALYLAITVRTPE